MLEAMAFGCLPVCGDLASIREWIEPGANGCLVNPDSAEETASAINAILDDPGKYKKWIETNHQIIQDRADRKKLQTELDSFYKKFI
jgi:glycosyltransferase involved in cell wall biosynthesis